MIEDLDETIKQLLIREGGLDPAEIDISFDVPDREWSASIVKPTLNFYLYDVRENTALRETHWDTVKNSDGTVTKRKSPRRIDCSYLLTAWTNAVEDEHRLMSSTLITLFRFPTLPTDVLQGSLVEPYFDIPTAVAQPDGVLKNPADVWTALDNQLKPALNYVVTLSLDPGRQIGPLTPVLARSTRISGPPPGQQSFGDGATANGNGDQPAALNGNGNGHEAGTQTSEHTQINGRVLDTRQNPVNNAIVVLQERGAIARTDVNGRYTFRGLPNGLYTLAASSEDRAAKPVKVAVPPAGGAKSYDLTL